MQYLGAISKITELSLFPKQNIQCHSNPSLGPDQSCWRSWSWMVLWRLQDLLQLTLKKDILFITGDWNAKVGSQEIPVVTGKFGLGAHNEAEQRLTEFCQENTLVIANILLQHRRLYTWTSPDCQYRNKIDYTLCSQRWRSSIQSAQTRLELTVAQNMNSLLPNSDLNWKRRENH